MLCVRQYCLMKWLHNTKANWVTLTGCNNCAPRKRRHLQVGQLVFPDESCSVGYHSMWVYV